jgi:tRNA pseudouridine65 synthase
MSDFPEIPVLYEDEDLIAVNKPAGLLMHRTPLSEDKVFLLQILRHQTGYKLYTGHRLDRATSGMVVFGKNALAGSELNRIFRERRVDKKYLAIVRGWIPENGEIDYPLLDAETDPSSLKEALTRFVCLAKSEISEPIGLRYQTARFSLAEIRPLTGRRHQIRKHFAHLRHPIIGDKKHGDVKHNKYFSDHFGLTRMFLHASELKLRHPFTGQQIWIQAPLDEVFHEGLKITQLILPT